MYGYGILELTREAATFTLKAVDKTNAADDVAAQVVRAFRVRAGTSEIVDVTAQAHASGLPREPRVAARR